MFFTYFKKFIISGLEGTTEDHLLDRRKYAFTVEEAS